MFDLFLAASIANRYTSLPAFQRAMMYYLRILAIVLSVLPQAFAPLVHAHVGADLSPSAIHLPGLEMEAKPGGGAMESYPAGFREGVVVSADRGVRKLSACFPPFPHVFLPPFWSADPEDSRSVASAMTPQAILPKVIRFFAFSRAPPA